MNLFLALLLLSSLGLISARCTKASVTKFTKFGVSSTPVCSGELIFEENFDNFDTTKWPREVTLSGNGNGEFQYYTDDDRVSYVKDGNLHIAPRLLSSDKGEDFLYKGTIDLGQSCTSNNVQDCKKTGQPGKILNPILSAKVTTAKSFSFRYGKLEARVKAPAGNWLWPAVWLLPEANKYGIWPASGEIDVMESRGNQDLGYPFTATSTLHWGPDSAHNMYEKTHYPKGDGSGYAAVFHYFQLEWTPEYISFSVDDHHYGKVTVPSGGFWELGNLDGSGLKNPWAGASKMAPFDQEFYILINLAVGGTNGYFPESYGKPWKNFGDRDASMTQFWEGKNQWVNTWNMDTDQSHFQIDYVRVWAL